MKIKKIIFFILLIIITIFFINHIYKFFFNKPKIQPFKTTTATYKNIYQTINATGALEIKDTMKIGSLVGGTIKNIYVKDNEKVKKRQLLAIIDNGKDDTEVKQAEGIVKSVEAELKYQINYYKRQKELYFAKQISTDYFEQVERDLEKTKANLQTAIATLRQKEIEFSNTSIIAPDDGIIILVGVAMGERITTDLDATILFKIAKDLTKMEVELNIDESNIGLIQKNQNVKFDVSAYPDKIFKGFITDVNYSPEKVHGILSYKALVDVNNKDLLLRPGMTINAEIKVAKSKHCLAITTQAFQISSKLIKAIAQKLKYKVKEINKKEIKTIEAKCNKQDAVKTIWTEENKNFIQKVVIVGITDDNFFEIKSGINEKNKVIIDIEEDDELKKLYQKIFKSAI